MVISKRLRIMGAALLIGTVMLDAAVIELSWLRPPTLRPSDANFINNPVGNGEVLIRLGEEKGETCEMIFIGASNVEYWCKEGLPVWNKYYAPRHAFNFGVAGDKTEDVLWRLDHVNLKSISPKVAVIFIGLNNFKDTPRDVAAGIKAVMKKTASVFPGIKILITGMTPSGRSHETVMRTNALLQGLADNRTVFYIDLYSKMPPEGDNWKGLKPDHLHFTEAGYEMWAGQMEPVLQKILPDSGVSMDNAPGSVSK
jgi:lysophospholipase L1-like esterase